MRSESIVEVDEAGEARDPRTWLDEGLGIRPLGKEGAHEALGPYIVLIRVSETDGTVAGEPNAMAALRYEPSWLQWRLHS